jgi:glycine cleavage system H protein
MDRNACQPVSYSRSRFGTKLPAQMLYTASHFWLLEVDSETESETESGQQARVWRVGFTRFATRMLGDLVEHDFEVQPGAEVTVGQTIGWVEGFKAASDLFCVVDGEFVRGNPALDHSIELLSKDNYGEGWLYEVNGTPEPNAVDVNGYTGILDAAIDKVQGVE